MMPHEEHKPRRFDDTTTWIKRINREWQFRKPVDLSCSIVPTMVEAASGHCFTVSLALGSDLEIPTGAHVTLEVPTTWEAHLGNCFRRGVRTVGNRAQIVSGYGALTEVSCTNMAVSLDLLASYGRIVDLVDVVVTSGTLIPGDTLRIHLGTPDSNPVQVQKHAQVAILPVGVDLEGNGAYRRAQHHPTVRVVGASAERLRVFAPAIARCGKAASVRILPVDLYSHNPASHYQGLIRLYPSTPMEIEDHLAIDSYQHPLGLETKATPTTSGIQRISAIDRERGISGRSNPMRVVSQPRERIYFGEMHSQMWRSMGTGTTAEFFEWGRDVAGLDFCAPANHYNWRYEVTEPIWESYLASINAYNDPGRFATLVSYEWGGSGSSGHKNVYFAGDEGVFSYWYRDRPSPDDLWKSLAPYRALKVPHHTKAFSGVDWCYRDDQRQRLVEICSKWGISEMGGDHSVQAALAMGHRLGFVGGSDSHYGLANQGSYHINDGNGLACVYAPELSRQAIWQALYDRHCYATTGDRMILDVSLDAQPMGTDLTTDLVSYGHRHLKLLVAGTDEIAKVEIIRNHEVVHVAEPASDVWEAEWVDRAPLSELAFQPVFPYDRPFVYYYVRATQINRQIAWSSPIWLTQRP